MFAFQHFAWCILHNKLCDFGPGGETLHLSLNNLVAQTLRVSAEVWERVWGGLVGGSQSPSRVLQGFA